MRRLLVLACLCLFAVLAVAASAPAQQGDPCTWGASSVVVEEVNGELVQSEPAVSGCIP